MGITDSRDGASQIASKYVATSVAERRQELACMKALGARLASPNLAEAPLIVGLEGSRANGASSNLQAVLLFGDAKESKA